MDFLDLGGEGLWDFEDAEEFSDDEQVGVDHWGNRLAKQLFQHLEFDFVRQTSTCRLFFALRNSKAAYALDRNRERHFSNCMFKSSIPDCTIDKDCQKSRRLCNSIELNRIYLVHGWF